MENLLSRKFLLTAGILVLSYALVLVGKLDTKTWLDMALGFVTIYSGANIVNKVVERK